MDLRVAIAENSAALSRVLAATVDATPGLSVVGVASDAGDTLALVQQSRPDVLVLDLAIPETDDLALLKRLQARSPTPVLALCPPGSDPESAERRACQAGASCVLHKPVSAAAVRNMCDGLGAMILRTAQARAGSVPTGELTWRRRVVAIGASTGGPEAVAEVLAELPEGFPGIVLVQHILDDFTPMFARRLDHTSRLEVREAQHGDVIQPGCVLVAPNRYHMVVIRRGREFVVELRSGAPIHHQKPAIDVTMAAVARALGSDSVGVLLTGMGVDGARGLLAMRRAGAHTMAQDQDSCVVFGMPGEAMRIGAADEMVPLPSIAQTMIRAASSPVSQVG